jgi:hypothetical protein
VQFKKNILDIFKTTMISKWLNQKVIQTL